MLDLTTRKNALFALPTSGTAVNGRREYNASLPSMIVVFMLAVETFEQGLFIIGTLSDSIFGHL